MAGLLGIQSTGILVPYLLCVASMLLCVVYGLASWNKGEEEVQPEDVKWVAEEKKVEEEL